MPKKFDFISPGVQLNEVDQSQLPQPVTDAGPVLIGRARSGPGMKPVRLNSYEDFVTIFGEPVSGEGASDADVWREGNVVGPTYAAYAAQAHLTSETTPLTFVRLLGEKNTNADTSANAALAGWNLGAEGAANTTISSNITAYGLFVFPETGAGTFTTGSLGAIIYANGAAVTLSGAVAGGAPAGGYTNTSSAGIMIDSISTGVANEFVLELHTTEPTPGGASSPIVRKTINFSNNSANYIRDKLNTNPQKLLASTNFGTTNQKYFLGETYEQAIRDQTSGSDSGRQMGMILPLQSGSFNFADHKRDMAAAKTGWFINRKPDEQKLFRLVSLHDGEWFQNNYEICVEDLKLGNRNTRSSFSLSLRNLKGNVVEKFSNLNLDPASDDYIAKRIGNQSFNWNETDLKYDIRGQYVNISDYFRVEVDSAVENKEIDDTLALPMGFLGPLRPQSFKLFADSEVPHLNIDEKPVARIDSEITPAVGNTTGIQFAANIAGVTNGDDDGAGDQGTITIRVPASLASSGTQTDYIIEFIDKDSSFSGASAAAANTVQVAATGLAALGGTQVLIAGIVEALSGGTISTPTRIRRHAGLDSGQSDIVVSAVTTDSGATTGIKIVSAASAGEGAITLITAAGGEGDITKAVPAGAGTQTGTTAANKGSGDSNEHKNAPIIGPDKYPLSATEADTSAPFAYLPSETTASVVFPSLRLTTQGSNRGGDYKKSDMFGIRHVIGSGKDRDSSYLDIIRALPGNNTVAVTHHQDSVPSSHERAFVFHLEDICVKAALTPATANGSDFFLISGSYDASNAKNVSYTGNGGSGAKDTGVAYLAGTKKIKQYKAAFFGGFDGLDIRHVMPFSNVNLADKTVRNSAPFNSIIKALDICADAETVEMDLLSIPGITNKTLTNKILDVAEERADSLAIIDLPQGYRPKWETGGAVDYGSLNTTVADLEARQINSSFGACYYPWVVVKDSNSDVVAMPPSVAAIGALAFSNADAGAVWFAPAGFNRGGIKNLGGSPTKSSGLIVTHTVEHLTKDNRDDLYAANINPIARFPATNQIVIFGQKTLQQTASALDRINVRRLLLFLKRRIGKIADTILFEPNVQTTWNNFKGAADTVLSQVQAGLGITEYKLVLDETTTTADLIDRNVLYAKIFIKPARAIEFIVVDFVVTRSGVEF